MARILFAWEMGGTLGPPAACASLGSALAVRGHGVAHAFRDLCALADIRSTTGVAVFQAPFADPVPDGVPPASYAELLLAHGYGDPKAISSLMGAWRAIFRRSGADLLVESLAPGALLAARIERIRCVRFGNGYALPPRVSPLPSFRFDELVSAERLTHADAVACNAINEVLQSSGTAPLVGLADLFASSEEMLCTLPELDHYGSRGAAAYWGPRFETQSGTHAGWPDGKGKRVLAYLDAGLPQLDALFAAIGVGGHRLVACLPGLDAAQRARLSARGRAISSTPLRLDQLLGSCDLLASHGGDLAAGSCARGVPQLVFPRHYEQYLTARRIEQLGCGAWLPASAAPAMVGAALERTLGDPRIAFASRAFAQRYPAYSPIDQRRRMALRIEQILGAQPILSRSPTPQSP